MKGRAGLERNFFHTSASRLMTESRARKLFQHLRNLLHDYIIFKVLTDLTVEALRDLLFGIGDMFLHVVEGTLCDAFLENKIFQLMAIAVIFDSSSDFTEAVQKHFVICTMLLVIPLKTQ